MDNVKIVREDRENRGIRYVATVDGVAGEGELTMFRAKKGVYVADHTGVPKHMGGNGIGSKLVRFMIEDARANELRVVPACPFIARKWEKHPEWSDVLISKDDM
ncbi:GNAT family N-acetyltransferase [Sphingorhabdus sp. Alg239-R122]|uniref:GNAT family N-acetyltransferase n=1 Tax=Sphingorhabdus sp. Alg239-R122 TaxID=2305989 RepID=UPI0013DC89B0|nr:GNAT family N-acetyltransferase [Sphingorhabdus sp. Alg239-R122]